MTITREAFHKGTFTAKAEANSRKDHPILKFLTFNSAKAFTVKEIAKAVKLSDAGIRSMLRHLIAAGYVKHKAPYFITVLNPIKKVSKKKKRR